MNTDAFAPSASSASTLPAAKEVHIRVAHDDDASRIAAVLEALGYRVMRELEEGDAPARLEWAVSRLARRHKLTKREQDILALVLEGCGNELVGRRLDISRATVKWHMHNLFAKTNTGNREALLRLALQLGSAANGTAAPVSREPAPRPAVSENKRPQSSITVRPKSQWRTGEEVTANIDFDQPRVPSADSIPSKSWF